MKSISHSPNSDWKQQLLAVSFFLPWKWRLWRAGKAVTDLEEELASYHGGGEVISFSAGRECLLAILKALDLKEEDEVIIQGYTCIVVPNAVIWAGAKPVYVDVDKTLNMDPELLEAAVTDKTKAIIVQHTFGTPANMDRISATAKKHDLTLIEDCAHSLGAEYNGEQVGTFGDISFFSFGRDKIISSVSGGAVYTRDSGLAKAVREIHDASSKRSLLWVKQNLLHLLLVPWMARLMGKLKVGEVLMMLSQKLRLLNKVYTKKELCQIQPDHSLHRLPNAMAALALQQLVALDDNLFHRRNLAEYAKHRADELGLDYQSNYENSAPAFLRFTLFVKYPEALMKQAKHTGYLLGNWYNAIVMPAPKQWEAIHLSPESLGESKIYTEQNINLPTSKKFMKSDLDKLLKLAKKQDESK